MSGPLGPTMPAGRLWVTWDERGAGDGGDLTLEWGQRRRHVGTIWIRPALTGEWIATWSTWDKIGAGGENACQADLATALEAVLGALLFQRWIPSLTAHEWRGAIEVAADLTEPWRLSHKLNTLRWSYAG